MRTRERLKDAFAVRPAARPVRWSLQRSQLRWTLVLGDLALVNLAALAALWLGVQRSTWWLAVGAWDSFTGWFLFLSVIWFVMAQVMDLYDLRVAGLPSRAARATLSVVVATLAVYLVLYFIAAPQSLPRHLIVFFALIAAPILSAWRAGFALALGAGPLARRAAVIGTGSSAQPLMQAIRESAHGYYCIVGALDPALPLSEVSARMLSAGALDEVILCAQDDLGADWLAALVSCREQGVQIVNLAAVYEELTGRVPVESVGKTWSVVLPLEQDATRGLNGMLKRALDALLAGAALAVLSPFLLLIVLAIRLDSRGATLVRQARVGRNGRTFTLYKFRTMVPDAEPPGTAVWAEQDDPRITRIGRALRRSKLDEVPQFWNVLRGEMSLVGPRPERPEIVSALQTSIPFYGLRHVVRPGMTGWAAVNFGYGRSVNDALVKLQYDLYYIKRQSLSLDVLILVKTLGAVLTPPRA